MKKVRLLNYMIAILAIMAVSCNDVFMDDNRVEEGIPVRVKLKFRSEEGKVITRAEQTVEYENRIENAYVFVFDGGGKIVYRYFFTEGENFTFDNGDQNHSSGYIIFDTKSMNDATIVGIANLRTATSGTAFPVTRGEMDAIADLNALKTYVMHMSDASVSRGGLFMMTGYAKDKAGNTKVVIPGDETGTSTLDATLQFERTDAKVKFVVKTAPKPPEGVTWRDFSFTPRTWEVKRVPKQSYLLEAVSGDYGGDVAVYFNTPPVPFDTVTTDPKNDRLYTGGNFVFYMPENKKTPKISVDNYYDRDAWTKEGGSRSFTNANDNSTYVEITGTVSYVDGKNMLVNAEVRLIVHLGYVTSRNGEPVTPDPNDYNTERNGLYTYNITVSGINSIMVEVDKGDEKRPGYEGDVVYSTTGIYEFDSHYDRRLIELEKDAIGTEMQWSVNTYFSRGIHPATDNAQSIEEKMRDYRWIKFAINADYGVDKNKYVKYPGDQNYNDPFPMDKNNNNLASPYYSSTYPSARLLDVNQLILRLQQEAANSESSIFFTDTEDGKEKVAITVFVDEHLYFNHPLTNEPGDEGRSLWKLTTDKEDRQLHIIAQGSQISEDGNSSIVNSTFSFKQRPISTIFNVDNDELKTAWGLESVMETGRMEKGTQRYGNSTSNGRVNTLDIILGTDHDKVLKWTDVLNTDDHYTLNRGYIDPAHACLLRNRDLNGNNIVEANEIRWYLAAIDQLTDIYIGEYALDEKSRLYPTNPADRNNEVRWHYISSSFTTHENNNNDAWILWAEEGASRGASVESAAGNMFSYRCARNLGLKLTEPNAETYDLIKVIPESGGSYLIDATRMNVKARRTNYEVKALPAHNERSANNLPYAKFRVHANTFPEPQYSRELKWTGYYISFNNALNWDNFQTYSPYPAGYRIPNQRELLIMTTRMEASAWPTYTERRTSGKPNYVCQTGFSLNGKPPYEANRDGFLWSAQSGAFFLQNSDDDKGYVRPVQDVQ